MIRTQISVTDEQARRLRRAAAGRDVSVAHLVREAIDAYVSDADTGWEARVERALAAAGRFDSGLTDVSERHDDYLAQEPPGW